MALNLKRQVLRCISKLGDRDTYSLAVSELESIAGSLDQSSLPTFLWCIHSTDSGDKPLVRKQCVGLLSLLAQAHGNSLSPYLSKILSTITKRLRDHDSSIRSTCVSSTASLALHLTKPPFSSFLKPLSDALFTEQDLNSQIGAALCLSSAVQASPDPDPARLAKILPRLEKLLKCDSFKAKSALITLIGSVVEVGAASSAGAMRSLVPSVLQFLSSEDWAARKAAAEVLLKLALLDRDMLPEFKAASIKVLDNRRCDKVKAVREVMNKTVEAWKQIPDVSDALSPPPKSQTSSREDAADGRYSSGSKNSCIASCGPAQMRKKYVPSSRSTPPERSSATTVRKRSPSVSSDTKTSPAIFRKLDRKKTSDWKVEVAVSHSPSMSAVCEDDLKKRGGSVPEARNNENSRFSKSETKRSLFNKNSEEKMHKFGGCRSGSRVVPCLEENSENTVLVSNVSGDSSRNHKESEELSLIRKQLIQIEKQQSSLLDVLQKFIGNSQSGMQSLETRVHGLEMALDGISYDLAVSSAKMSKADSLSTTCCRLPGADFLSSKFWRRSEGRCSTSSLIPSGGAPSMALGAMHYRADNNGTASNLNFQNPRFQLQGGGGLIVNPLAEIPNSSRGNSGVARY